MTKAIKTDEPAEYPVLSVRVPHEFRDRLDAYCREHDRIRSQVVRIALNALFAKDEARHE